MPSAFETRAVFMSGNDFLPSRVRLVFVPIAFAELFIPVSSAAILAYNVN